MVKKKRKSKELALFTGEIIPDFKELSTQHELFCQLYVNNSEFFGNATFCYAAAYGMDLEKGSHKTKKNAYKVAQVNGSRLLSNAIIRRRIYQLLNQLMKDEVVDGELAKVIMQNYKLDVKVQAIREYNRIKNRVKPGPNQMFQLNLGKLRDEYQ